MYLRPLFVAIATSPFLALGCAADQPAPAYPPDHPANPAGIQSPEPKPSTTLQTASPPESKLVSTTAPSSTTTNLYACPMHPEVTSNKPGNCSKCGMQLVKKGDEK